MTSFVHENLHEDVSLIQMAQEAKLSPAYSLKFISLGSWSATN